MFGVIAGFVASIYCACAVGASGMMTVPQVIAFCFGLGFVHAPLVLIGHELGHAVGSPRDMRVARFALALVGYGQFTIEHNSGHHIHVATPQDPASARYNESFYRFALREIPGVFAGALKAERARLALICACVWVTITMANYTARYGILRRWINGRREPCRPEHSWNSSFFFSNILFFNLQRHSDHHTNAQKPFQLLADVDNAPELPSGYPGVFFMMLIPPLWFAVMNPLLHDAMEHDATRLNTG